MSAQGGGCQRRTCPGRDDVHCSWLHYRRTFNVVWKYFEFCIPSSDKTRRTSPVYIGLWGLWRLYGRENCAFGVFGYQTCVCPLPFGVSPYECHRVPFKLVVMVHRCLNGPAPQYLDRCSLCPAVQPETSPFRGAKSTARTTSPTQHVWPPGLCCCWSVRLELSSDPVRNPNTEAACLFARY